MGASRYAMPVEKLAGMARSCQGKGTGTGCMQPVKGVAGVSGL